MVAMLTTGCNISKKLPAGSYLYKGASFTLTKDKDNKAAKSKLALSSKKGEHVVPLTPQHVLFQDAQSETLPCSQVKPSAQQVKPSAQQVKLSAQQQKYQKESLCVSRSKQWIRCSEVSMNSKTKAFIDQKDYSKYLTSNSVSLPVNSKTANDQETKLGVLLLNLGGPEKEQVGKTTFSEYPRILHNISFLKVL
jgi:hypothetical protein